MPPPVDRALNLPELLRLPAQDQAADQYHQENEGGQEADDEFRLSFGQGRVSYLHAHETM